MSGPEALPPTAAGASMHDPTRVPTARSADISQRTRTYLIAMLIRLVCLILILVVPGWWKLLVLGLAIGAPLFGVLVANDQAVARDARERVDARALPELERPQHSPPAAPSTMTLVMHPDGSFDARASGEDDAGEGEDS